MIISGNNLVTLNRLKVALLILGIFFLTILFLYFKTMGEISLVCQEITVIITELDKSSGPVISCTNKTGGTNVYPEQLNCQIHFLLVTLYNDIHNIL